MAVSPGSTANCTHIIATTFVFTSSDINTARESRECNLCDSGKGDYWLCLHKECLLCFCKDDKVDHRLLHYKNHPEHSLYLHVTLLHFWCYQCDLEFLLTPLSHNAEFQQPVPNSRLQHTESIENEDSDDNHSYDMDDNSKPMGLTGLQNIGNTCYMNAALQALSNTPPLTQFFLDCGMSAITSITATNSIPAANGDSNKKPLVLSKAYHRLMQDIWDRQMKGCVAPTGILYGIRNAHPMFRGYHQHDTQEFLRCFMDLLHEELKVPLIEPPAPTMFLHERMTGIDEDMSDCELEREKTNTANVLMGDGEIASASSQSEGDEYETCDSGVSERSSLSEEGSSTKGSTKRKCFSRSPSPPPEKLRSKLTSSTKDPRRGSSPRASHRSRKQIKYRSIISDVFDGKLLSSVQCLTCNRISTRVEAFQDLSLPIPSRDHLNMLHQGSVNSTLAKCTELYSTDQGWLNWLWEWLCSWFWGPTVSLHDCLSAFFSADELKGDNMYSCEKCNKLRNGVKYSKVLELPEVLCIHLKRFRHELMFSSKISSHVTFPLEGLELKPYLHKDCISQVTSYDLISVICHHGAAGSGGHYTCYSLNAHSEQWYEFDDQCVTKVSPDVVRTCEAYVLFYRKNGSSMDQLRRKALHLHNLTPVDHPGPMYIISKQWLNKFNTFAEPGPIDNTDLFCHHNRLLPNSESNYLHLANFLPAPVWDYLYEKFGGGPVCTDEQLNVCEICCNRYSDSTPITRQEFEMREFSKLEQELQIMTNNGQQLQMNALSLQWFISWNNFIKGCANEPPGPIDNSHLVTSTNDGALIQVKDYRQVSKDQWEFLYGIYRGGPEIVSSISNGQPIFIVNAPSQPISINNSSYPNSQSPESCSSVHQQQPVTLIEPRAGDSCSSGHWSMSTQDEDQSSSNPETAEVHQNGQKHAQTIAYSPVLSSGDHLPMNDQIPDSEFILDSILDVRIDPTTTEVNCTTAEHFC